MASPRLLRLLPLLPLLLLSTPAHGLHNSALVFLKPHAATDVCEAFLRDHLAAAAVRVVSSGTIPAAQIEAQQLIDRHYGSLAKLAMHTDPVQLALPDSARAAFSATFGLEWHEALPAVMRNDLALAALGVDGAALEAMWRAGEQLKLAPGTYISRLRLDGDEKERQLFTLNGFYPAMRQAFVAPGAEVRYLVCEFREEELSWRAFRRDVIGATDPALAAAGSARRAMLEQWESLRMSEAPTQARNGVHASAGPLEGLKERCVWVGASVAEDALGAALLGGGVDLPTLERWLEENPTVSLGGKTDKVFDLTEEMGTDAMVEMVAAAYGGESPSGAPSSAGAPPPLGFEWGGVY
ncbi:hypothetical protein AB1Y20_021598 [Prymnesium parvum]|uniref:Nucleoside-diphosphate kinase n=1 Tax=Prymnesium parvum TaxID=97485 RepID=A0AB34JL33_PRYPA